MLGIGTPCATTCISRERPSPNQPSKLLSSNQRIHRKRSCEVDEEQMTRRPENVPTRAAAKHAHGILSGQRRIPSEIVLNPRRCRACRYREERLGPRRMARIQETLPFKASLQVNKVYLTRSTTTTAEAGPSQSRWQPEPSSSKLKLATDADEAHLSFWNVPVNNTIFEHQSGNL